MRFCGGQFKVGARLIAFKGGSDRIVYGFEYSLFVRKLDFKLCRVNVNVNRPRVYVDIKNAGRIFFGCNKLNKRLFYCGTCRAALYIATVNKEGLH